MRFVFRVDGSLKIGGGHIVRCLNLAKILKKKDFEIIFVTTIHDKDFTQEIQNHDFNLIVNRTGLNYEAFEWIKYDLDFFCEHIRSTDTVILDHYYLDSKWEKAVRSKVKKLIVIDDLKEREHDCDVYINYNVVDDIDVGFKVNTDAIKLIGSKFCILSKNFKPFKRWNFDRFEINNILLFFGSNDAYNFCSKVFLSIEQKYPDKFYFDIVVGKNSEHNQELLSLKRKYSERINLHIQTSSMNEIMENADLFIGSGGTVTWERCIKSLPALVITVADNQIYATDLMHKKEALVYVGHYSQEKILEKLILNFENLRADSKIMTHLAQKSFNMVKDNSIEILLNYI